MAILYLILAILSSAAMTIILKLFRNQEGNRYGLILGNYLTCTALSACFLPGSKAITPAETAVSGMDLPTLLCGLIAGFLFVAGLVGMQSSIQKNGAILTSAFSKMGLIVPLGISLLFLHETMNLRQLIGILLILASVWIISTDRGSASRQDTSTVRPLLLICVLLTCGGGDAMAKIFDSVSSSDTDTWYFLVLFATASLLTLGLLLLEHRGTHKRLILKECLMGIAAGIPNYFSSFLLLQALKGLPAFLVYPCFSTGSLILISIVGIFGFRERPSTRKWIGLAITTAALILLAV